MRVVVEVYLPEESTTKLRIDTPGSISFEPSLILVCDSEDRVGHLHRYGGDDRGADVRRIVILVIELLDGLCDGLTESRLMGAALRACTGRSRTKSSSRRSPFRG